MEIRGATAEQRKQARRQRTGQRRAIEFRGRLQAAAGNPSGQLTEACAYLRAIADDLPPAQVAELAKQVAGLADKWSTT